MPGTAGASAHGEGWVGAPPDEPDTEQTEPEEDDDADPCEEPTE